MEDRELLGLAAKATAYVSFDGFTFIQRDRYSANIWHPIHDDGDALRLAVYLGILLRTDFIKLLSQLLNEGIGHSEATRLAIVRIAAEIGRTAP